MTRQGLILFFTHDISLGQWAKAGFLEREVAYYKNLSNALGNVYFLTYGGQEDLEFADSLNGIQVLNNYRRVSSYRFSFEAVWSYRQHLRQIGIYKTNQLRGSWTAIMAKWLWGGQLIVRAGNIPSLQYQRQYGTSRFRSLRLQLIEAVGLWAADRIFLPTAEMIEYVAQVYKIPRNKIYLIPNFVETDIFKPDPTCKPVKGLIGFVGRFTQQKNLQALIEAASMLNNIRLRFMGDGPLQDRLATQAKKLGVAVEFLGPIPNHDIPRYLHQCQAFAFPSLYEGHPKALLEAMACGCPVITTPVQGTKSLIKHCENGYLCADTSAEAIRHGLQVVMEDSELRQHIASQARRFVVNNFSLDKVLEKELAIYRETGLL